MKYAVPTGDGKTVSDVFGRAASFAIYDDADKAWKIVANGGINAEHGAGTGAVSFLAEQGVQAILAPELGPKAAAAAQAAGMTYRQVKTGLSLADALLAQA